MSDLDLSGSQIEFILETVEKVLNLPGATVDMKRGWRTIRKPEDVLVANFEYDGSWTITITTPADK